MLGEASPLRCGRGITRVYYLDWTAFPFKLRLRLMFYIMFCTATEKIKQAARENQPGYCQL